MPTKFVLNVQTGELTEEEVAPEEIPAIPLADLKTWALAELNRWRGERRKTLGLSDAWGQELVYSGKWSEAKRFKKNPNETWYFSLEAAARGLTDEEMADLIVSQGEAWLAGSDQIEADYWAAKVALEAAADEAGVAAVLAGLEWPPP